MVLPKNERVNLDLSQPPVIWLYGPPFSGKSTFANGAPDIVNLNTDNNLKFLDCPRVSIKDDIKMNGRIEEKTFAWEVFEDTVRELVIGDHSFKNIAVDLVEHIYESCRLYMFDKLGIDHEQDAGHGKGYDMVKLEFFPEVKKLTNAGYGVILISHEISNEINLKGGGKITTFAPNVPPKVANTLSGLVDIVGHVVIDNNGERWIDFTTNEHVFGGGRLEFPVGKIPLNYDAFMENYKAAKVRMTDDRNVPSVEHSTVLKPQGDSPTEEAPKPRRGRPARPKE